MGLLDQLWDDTVAGPRPENGLGKLRKYSSLNSRSASGKELEGGNARSYGDEDGTDEAIRVTRKIMIVKPPGYQSGSPPVSPAGSTPPEGDQSHFGFVGGLPRMLTKRQWDQGAPLVLMMCEM
ncbi:dormancy-associated protein homolog 3 isoform X2 [Malania oleifera]|uniref:dormancy-associated protein homolog 3 isoform X2 n=1 Tax=Malania oleifera TaxID=397392 RepID=UPI0025AE9DDB|nr:dormancy-associated protein homolog 3 isoform X2 [Malania oleifera]